MDNYTVPHKLDSKKNRNDTFNLYKDGQKPYVSYRNNSIFLPNQVWAVDITYIKMGKSHMYLTAIIDWYSRFIVRWALSDTLDTTPVIEAV